MAEIIDLDLYRKFRIVMTWAPQEQAPRLMVSRRSPICKNHQKSPSIIENLEKINIFKQASLLSMKGFLNER